MTQQDIRRVSLCLLATVVISFTSGLLFLVNAGTYLLNFEHDQEMLRRVGYVTAMLEWMPTTDTLTESDWLSIKSICPFSLEALSLTASDVRSMTVSNGYPYRAYQYSEPLQAVIALEERFNADVAFGCAGELYGVGGSVVFLTCAVVLLLMLVANLVAYLVPATPMYGRAIAVVAMLSPIAFGAVLVAAITQVEGKCSVQTWSDDVRRSVMLVASIYSLLDSLYPKSFPVELLTETLESLNTLFIKDNLYSMHLVEKAVMKITPSLPKGHENVHDILLSGAAANPRYVDFVTSSQDIISTYSVPTKEALLAGVRNIKEELPRVSGVNGTMAFTLVMVPQTIFCLIALVLFPYKSLGKLTGADTAWQGPWVWRASRRWPLWKIFQAAIVVCFTVGMLSHYVEQLSTFYSVSEVYFANMRALIQGGVSLSDVGLHLMTNYANLLNTQDWDDGWLKYAEDPTTEDIVSVNHFYQSVFTTLSGYQYSLSSVAEHAAKVPKDKLPLLNNNMDVLTFIRSVTAQGHNVQNLEAAISTWDVMMVFYILTADTEKLREGSSVFGQMVVVEASILAPDGDIIMDGLIRATILNAAEYADIAEALDHQTVGPQNVADLFKSDRGREVVHLEESCLYNQRAQWPESMRYDSPYVFADGDICVWIGITVAALGLAAIADYIHAAVFFGSSRGRDGGSIGGRTVLSNDYTAPSSFLTVNHHHLWSGVRRASFAMLAIVLLCIATVCVNGISISAAVLTVMNERQYNDAVSAPVIQDANGAGMMYITSAAWLRAYLSRSLADVATATLVSNMWTTLQETIWVDGKPASLASTEDESHLRDRLRAASSQVTTTSSDNPQASAYGDFVLLLMEHETHFNPGVMYNCFPTPDFHQAMATMERFLINLLYFTMDTMEDVYADFQVIFDNNEICFPQAQQEALFLFLRRLQALRLRTIFFPSRQELADALERTSIVATREAVDAVEAIEVAEIVNGAQWSVLVWMPIIVAWICAPLIYCVHRAATQIYFSIYCA